MEIKKNEDGSYSLTLSPDELRYLAEAIEGVSDDPALMRHMPDSYWEQQDRMWAAVANPIIVEANVL